MWLLQEDIVRQLTTDTLPTFRGPYFINKDWIKMVPLVNLLQQQNNIFHQLIPTAITTILML
jgi:hypothetical protein